MQKISPLQRITTFNSELPGKVFDEPETTDKASDSDNGGTTGLAGVVVTRITWAGAATGVRQVVTYLAILEHQFLAFFVVLEANH